MKISIRPAKTSDMPYVQNLIQDYVDKRILLGKDLVVLYEETRDFVVAEIDIEHTPEDSQISALNLVEKESESLLFANAGDSIARQKQIIGCGALHIFWKDLAEIRTLCVMPNFQGTGTGAKILSYLLDNAKQIGVKRIFCLTFETKFFASFGFKPLPDKGVDKTTYMQMLKSHDIGLQEFLELESVKKNTLGNTRMMLNL